MTGNRDGNVALDLITRSAFLTLSKSPSPTSRGALVPTGSVFQKNWRLTLENYIFLYSHMPISELLSLQETASCFRVTFYEVSSKGYKFHRLLTDSLLK